MKKKFTFFTLFFLSLTCLTFAQTQVGNTITNSNQNSLFGGATALSGDGSRIVIGEPRYEVTYPDFLGALHVYELQNDTWQVVGSPILGGNDDGDFGLDVAISADGNRIAASSPGNNTGGQSSGQVRVYDWVGGSWTLIGSIDGKPGRRLRTVDISDDGNRVIVGGIGTFDSSGVVAVYEFAGGTSWNPVGDEFVTDFTTVVCISGDGNRISFADFNLTTRFEVYDWDNGQWTTTGQNPSMITLTSPILSQGGNRIAGWNIDYLTYDTVVIVMELQGGDWVQMGSDIPMSVGNGGGSPRMLSFSGDGNRLALGNTYSGSTGDPYDFFPGTVTVLDWQNGSWDNQVGMTLQGAEAGAYFGQSVSFSKTGSRLSVGAMALGDNPTSGGEGYAQVFDFSEFVSTKNLIQIPVDIYPNPTTGEVFISGLIPDQIRITDQTGRVVRYFENGEQQVDLSDLASGIYFITIIAEDKYAIEKIIKQ